MSEKLKALVILCYQGMQSRDSYVQGEQVLGLRCCLQEP